MANKVQLGSLVDQVRYAGTVTTAGGAAAEVVTVANVASTDIVYVGIKAVGATPRTIVSAAAGTGSITVTFSGDPSNDHVLYYIVVPPLT